MQDHAGAQTAVVLAARSGFVDEVELLSSVGADLEDVRTGEGCACKHHKNVASAWALPP